jgi:GTPase
MNYPKLALVGRPNVGKSALFNRICQKRVAIVDEEEGVTRDRSYSVADLFGKKFFVIDTGGIDPLLEGPFTQGVRRQSEKAIEEADRVILVVDGMVGLTDLDRKIAELLFQMKKPFVVAVNKMDCFSDEEKLHSFHSLGVENIFAVSALHGQKVVELLECALLGVEWTQEEEKEEEKLTRIAIVGRPNVGKSTLLNYLVGEERTIVSDVAGTTRDAIDVEISVQGKRYLLVDTAGIRKRNKYHSTVEKFADLRSKEAIEKSDLCLLLLDVREGMTTEDKKIASWIEEKGKGCVLLLNKWDLIRGYRMETCAKEFQKEVPFFTHCPLLFVSAKTGRNLEALFSHIANVENSLFASIGTPALNRFVEKCLQEYHPPAIGGKRLRIYYLTQVAKAPPSFVLFVNYPNLLTESYKKYLINSFRKTFSFIGVPVFFFVRGKSKG